MNENALKANIWKYRIFYPLHFFHFVAPVLILFALSFGGSLTLATFIISTVIYLFMIVFELPSGIFADLFGRKNTVVMGVSIAFIGSLLFALGTNYWWLGSGMALIGIGASLISGSAEALFYDSLIAIKLQKEYKKIKGSILFSSYILIAITSIIGGAVYVVDKRLPFLLASLFAFISLIISFTFTEPPYKKVKHKKWFLHLKESLTYLVKSRPLLWITLYSIITFDVLLVFHRNFAPLFLEHIGLALVLFGLVFAILRIVSSVGAKLTHWFDKQFGTQRTLLISGFMIGIIFFIFSLAGFIMGIISLVLLYFFTGVLKPLIDDSFHTNCISSQRATILSIRSMIFSLVSALLAVIFGALILKFSLSNLFFFQGIILAILVLLLFLFFPKIKSKKKHL